MSPQVTNAAMPATTPDVSCDFDFSADRGMFRFYFMGRQAEQISKRQNFNQRRILTAKSTGGRARLGRATLKAAEPTCLYRAVIERRSLTLGRCSTSSESQII